MIINRLLKISLVILGLAYLILNVFKVGIYADIVGVVIMFAFSNLYLRQTDANRKRNPYFFLFLVFFTLSQVIQLASHFININAIAANLEYYASNICYMLSYVFLILRCVMTMKFGRIIKNFSVTILILIVLGIFCVTLITETAETKLNIYQYNTEFLYNIIIMALLSVALVNYMDKSDTRSMLFFIGCMFIFFSEMLQLAYYYVQELPHLAAIYSLFLILAFLFYYLQAGLRHEQMSDFSFLETEFSASKKKQQIKL